MISPLGRGHRGRAHRGSSNTALDGCRGSGSGGGGWGYRQWQRRLGLKGQWQRRLGLPVVGAPRLELTAGGGECRRIRGRKERAPRVFAIAGLEKIKFERERGVSETGKVKVK